jgi:hypothetical protein
MQQILFKTPVSSNSKNVFFSIINHKQAVNFLLPLHYSGRKPNVKYAFGYFENEVLKAVCCFGKPASPFLCIGVCGELFSNKVFELNRLCVNGDIKIQLSQFVSWCLNQLRSKDLIIVSYADTQMNHHGYIYQATNWIYTGLTKERTDKYVDGNKHARHYKKGVKNELRKYRSSKHRYIYFATNKTNKKKYMKHLKYPIEPYPKGDNKRYVLGEFLNPISIVKNDF